MNPNEEVAGTPTPYAERTVKELQEILKDRELPTGGNKDEIIARLESSNTDREEAAGQRLKETSVTSPELVNQIEGTSGETEADETVSLKQLRLLKSKILKRRALAIGAAKSAERGRLTNSLDSIDWAINYLQEALKLLAKLD